jgi:D-glucosaminate PTS system EIID component
VRWKVGDSGSADIGFYRPWFIALAAVFSIYFYLTKKGPRYTTILLSVVVISVVCSLLGVL